MIERRVTHAENIRVAALVVGMATVALTRCGERTSTMETRPGGEISGHLLMTGQTERALCICIESLMAGRPVLISDQTPWRGLEQEKCGWDVPLAHGAGSEEQGERTTEREMSRERGAVRDEMHPEPSRRGSAWCTVLGALLEMEQEEFNTWCKGARERATKFISDPELLVSYEKLFDLNT